MHSLKTQSIVELTCEASVPPPPPSEANVPPPLTSEANVPPPLPSEAPDQWLVVKYNQKHYVGQVESLNSQSNSIVVRFIRRKDSNSYIFHWPDREDVDTITKEQVVLHLPPPQSTRRGYLMFAVPLDVYNIK